MIMVGHETPGENGKRVALMCVEKSSLQFVHVFWCAENRLPVVAAHDDVVIGIWIELASAGHKRSPSDRGMREFSCGGSFRWAVDELTGRVTCGCLELRTMLIKIPSFF